MNGAFWEIPSALSIYSTDTDLTNVVCLHIPKDHQFASDRGTERRSYLRTKCMRTIELTFMSVDKREIDAYTTDTIGGKQRNHVVQKFYT